MGIWGQNFRKGLHSRVAEEAQHKKEMRIWFWRQTPAAFRGAERAGTVLPGTVAVTGFRWWLGGSECRLLISSDAALLSKPTSVPYTLSFLRPRTGWDVRSGAAQGQLVLSHPATNRPPEEQPQELGGGGPP